MGRRPAWRRVLQGGVGTSGWMAAFLLGMAAAMLYTLISAGGGMSEFGGPDAENGADRMERDNRGTKRNSSDGKSLAEGGSFSRTDRTLAQKHISGRTDGQRLSTYGSSGRTNGDRKAGTSGQTGRRQPGGSDSEAEKKDGVIGQAGARDEPLVRVYLAGENRVETVPLETYVRGVVAGEMPADFELEALKAQAIAARTYIVRKLLAEGRDGGDSGREYDVTDGETDQVYIPLEKMERLERERKDDLARIGRAVAETEGLVLTYEGEPIQAAYFSTSGGYTENAEDYWSVAVPYLRSVPSPWDAQLSPRFEQEFEMTLDEFYERLGIGRRDRKGGIEVLSRTAGRSVKEIRIGKRVLTGREVREALDLPSANFDWRIAGGRITLICRGHGHGVGMSQWGAQALALAGNDAEQILAWYYRGARLAALSESFKT